MPQSLIDVAEDAIVVAARRLDRSLDRRQFHGEMLLPAEVRQRYEDELAVATSAAHKERLLTAILDRDGRAFSEAVQSSLPGSAEAVLDAALIQELHATMRTDRRFWFCD